MEGYVPMNAGEMQRGSMYSPTSWGGVRCQYRRRGRGEVVKAPCRVAVRSFGVRYTRRHAKEAVMSLKSRG